MLRNKREQYIKQKGLLVTNNIRKAESKNNAPLQLKKFEEDFDLSINAK
jgi:hypothetical protein